MPYIRTYIRTYIVLGTSLVPACNILVTAGTSLVITAHTATALHENSKRLWTRAEVDGGANNGPPMTPTLGDVQGQRSMDTHRGSNTNFIK